jgi:exopolysaccharide biosynthesis operon protein EpsL
VKFIIGLGCALAAAHAAAQQDRPVMLHVGGSLASHTNPLRQPDARSDRITVLSAGLSVDQPYAQQRLLLDVTSTAYRYARLSFLDFDALDYRGMWAWRLGRRWNGMLGAERTQALVNYSEFGDPSRRNVLTAERRFLSADGWIFGGWYLRTGLEQQEHKYSVPFPQLGSYRASGAEGGIEYVARSTSSAALKLRVLDGQYVDRPLDPVARLDDGFKRSETELALTWVTSARSAFDLRVARLDYRASHFAERDFSGTVSSLTYRWTPAARLALNLSAARTREPWADQVASYRAIERKALDARWEIAARSTLRLGFARQDADYRNPLPTYTGAGRFDALRSAQLALEWRLRRNVTLEANLQRQRQSSSEPAARFEARVASLGASLRF